MFPARWDVPTQKSEGESDINLTSDSTGISQLHWKRQGQRKLFLPTQEYAAK